MRLPPALLLAVLWVAVASLLLAEIVHPVGGLAAVSVGGLAVGLAVVTRQRWRWGHGWRNHCQHCGRADPPTP